MLEVAVAAAQAGARVLRAYGLAPRATEIKGVAGDRVTEVDHASENAILEVLTREAPGVAILAEESGGVRDKAMWVVDPLDGTTNYSRRLPIVCVSVSLVNEGVPEVGVVIAPWLDLIFTAERGNGAWLNGDRLPRLERGCPEDAIVATCFPYRERHRMPQYAPVLEGALSHFEDLRRGGAAALDLAWTSAGGFDGLFALNLGAWDIAAGAALVLEVGGVITDWRGQNGWIESGDILAGPPAIHEALLDLARQI
jgi:myo-inositol-1(or 4)-monophosphatase